MKPFAILAVTLPLVIAGPIVTREDACSVDLSACASMTGADRCTCEWDQVAAFKTSNKATNGCVAKPSTYCQFGLPKIPINALPRPSQTAAPTADACACEQVFCIEQVGVDCTCLQVAINLQCYQSAMQKGVDCPSLNQQPIQCILENPLLPATPTATPAGKGRI